MANGSTIAPTAVVLGGASRVRPWTPAAPAEQWADRTPNGRFRTPRDDAALVRATAEARTALREAASVAAEAAARARSLAELLDETLTALTDVEALSLRASRPAPRSQPEAITLSPREREVLALVAEGRTNKAIAAELFVSPNTVKTHVTSLLHKLRAETRVQLAAIATRQGLGLHQPTVRGG